jgi:hypothetical protein
MESSINASAGSCIAVWTTSTAYQSRYAVGPRQEWLTCVMVAFQLGKDASPTTHRLDVVVA